MNLSNRDDETTARTCPEAAQQRASFLHSWGAKSVLELCVGPSLETLTEAYRVYGIECWGNDIDPRWKHYYPPGNWIIGDALTIELSGWVDAVVFAPPLSRGCSGRREDSLQVEQVTPSYLDFLRRWEQLPKGRGPGHAILVLPARTMVPGRDHEQLYKLMDQVRRFGGRDEWATEIKVGRRQIRKYVEVAFHR